MSEITKLKDFFSRILDYKTQILIRVAIIGVVIGCVAVAFRLSTEKLVELLAQVSNSGEHWYPWVFLPLFCAAGGLLAGLVTNKVAPDAKGSGIPQVKHVLNSSGANIKLRTIIAKFVGGVAGIASGLSLGREGPTIQISAGIASKLSPILGGKHRKRAIASGAGAGLAAAFNTPIAGVMFVIEELDRNFSSLSLGPAIVASVAAAFTCRMLYGDFFTFHFQCDCPITSITLIAIVILGVLSAIFGTYFQRSVLFSVNFYKKYFVAVPAWSWGAIAGLITGVVGIWVPQALGGGHTTLEGVLAGAYAWSLIPLIFLAKYLLTVIAYGSGVPGGIFAPALILGALLGSGLGHLLDLMVPSLNVDPASFAFVGMGAFFTAISRAPITSIVMLFELTGNYQLVLPLMFGCIIANISAERLKEGSIYANLLENDGINIREFTTPSYLQRFSIQDAMTRELDTIEDTMTIRELHELFDHSDHTGFPVLNASGKLVGIVTHHDIHEAFDIQLDQDTPVAEIMSAELRLLSMHDNLHAAILKLYEYKIGRLLIVDEHQGNKLVGIITRSDIINFEANQELDY